MIGLHKLLAKGRTSLVKKQNITFLHITLATSVEPKARNIGPQQMINASTKIAKVLAFLRSLTYIERPPAEQKIPLL